MWSGVLSAQISGLLNKILILLGKFIFFCYNTWLCLSLLLLYLLGWNLYYNLLSIHICSNRLSYKFVHVVHYEVNIIIEFFG